VATGAPAGGAVLDVGAGTGRLLIEIAVRRPDLTLAGIDLSPDMIILAEKHARDAGVGQRVALRTGDVGDLPYPAACFDLIVSTLSMHHWPDLPSAVRELARVLRPGGTLWIYDFRFVADRAFVTAANEEPGFGGQPVHRAVLRPGLLPIYVRLAVSKPPTKDTSNGTGTTSP
jgi:ubiquinone/menaquinone biosynthesis C-methylase UbiE